MSAALVDLTPSEARALDTAVTWWSRDDLLAIRACLLAGRPAPMAYEAGERRRAGLETFLRDCGIGYVVRVVAGGFWTVLPSPDPLPVAAGLNVHADVTAMERRLRDAEHAADHWRNVARHIAGVVADTCTDVQLAADRAGRMADAVSRPEYPDWTVAELTLRTAIREAQETPRARMPVPTEEVSHAAD